MDIYKSEIKAKYLLHFLFTEEKIDQEVMDKIQDESAQYVLDEVLNDDDICNFLTIEAIETLYIRNKQEYIYDLVSSE